MTTFIPGLSDAQTGSINNLVSSDRAFSQTDANNYSYATGAKDASQYVGKTGSQITADSLKPVTPITFPPPETPVDQSGSMMDGAKANINDIIKQLTPTEPTAAEKSQQSILDSISGLTGDFGNKGADQLTAEQSAGLPDLRKQYADINGQILTKSAEYDALSKSLEGQGRGLTTGMVTGQQGAVQRQKASEVGLLTARAQALNGQIDVAQSTVNRSIDLKYSTIESKINTYQAQLNALLPTLNKEEKIQAQAQQTLLDQQKQAIADKKDEESKIQTVMLEAAQAGLTDGSVLAKISAAKTAQEALQIAGPYIGKAANDKQKNVNFGKVGQDADGNDIYGFVDSTNKTVTPFNATGAVNTLTGNTGVVVTSTGQAYDIKSYATDPNHEASVQSILNKMGQMTSIQQMNSYIKSAAPNSPVTGEMIANAAGKYGVSWEMMMAIMQQDSSFGTAGKAIKTLNPGNVGNTDSGATVTMKSWQDGVDAVAKNLASRVTTAPEVKPGSAEDVALQIFNGTSNLDVKSLPTAKRVAVDKALNKLKADALAKGDVEGVIKASAGGKEVDATTATSFEKAFNVLSQISELQDTISGESTGPILGIIRSNDPYDKKAQLIKAQLAAIVPNLARGVYGEVGVLTDNDIKNYSQTLPNLTSTEDVRNLILGATIKSVQRSLETKIRTQAGLGRDVSGLLNLYTSVSTKADSLLAPTLAHKPGDIVNKGDATFVKVAD